MVIWLFPQISIDFYETGNDKTVGIYVSHYPLLKTLISIAVRATPYIEVTVKLLYVNEIKNIDFCEWANITQKTSTTHTQLHEKEKNLPMWQKILKNITVTIWNAILLFLRVCKKASFSVTC